MDLIIRQHAIAEIYEEFMTIDMEVHDKSAQRCMDILSKLPSVSQPTQTCVEPTHKHVENTLDCVGDRAISLETVIEWLKAKDIIKLSSQEEIARKELKQLLSVNPQPTGHWITEDRLHPKCDQCGWEYGSSMTKFCPNCGAKMERSNDAKDSN